ncbi:hypothetical protein BDZ97DRAFT_1656349, partial [Flammula alnicola]
MAWLEIQQLAPTDFLDYLVEYWMTDEFRPMWSGVYRKDRLIYEQSDTNMILEAWHHVLKGKFLESRRNRRLDHLLYILLCKVVEYYALKDRREYIGFEGPDLEVRKRKAILERS